MALVKCPECSKEVSDSAEACPSCAFPIARRIAGSHETATEPPQLASEDVIKTKSKAAAIIFVLIAVGLVAAGYFYVKREGIRKDIAESLKSNYGYSDSGYNFSLATYRKEGAGEYATMTVTYLPESISWDISCLKIGDVWQWGPSPEQRAKDMGDLDDIGHCLGGLAGGLRIGDNVYNSGSEINSCRDAIQAYNIRHPKSRMTNINAGQ